VYQKLRKCAKSWESVPEKGLIAIFGSRNVIFCSTNVFFRYAVKIFLSTVQMHAVYTFLRAVEFFGSSFAAFWFKFSHLLAGVLVFFWCPVLKILARSNLEGEGV